MWCSLCNLGCAFGQAVCGVRYLLNIFDAIVDMQWLSCNRETPNMREGKCMGTLDLFLVMETVVLDTEGHRDVREK